MKRIACLALIGITIACFFSCNKNKDRLFPEIIILSPVDYSEYQVGDTVYVEAEVKDDKQLSYIFIQLMDENMRPVDKSLDINTGQSKVKHFQVGYVISNNDLLSGVYWLKIETSDGMNVSKEYVQLSISSLPLERKGIVLVSTPSSNSTFVDLLNLKSNSTTNLANISSDFLSMSVHSGEQKIIVCPQYTNKLTCIDALNHSIAWQYSEVYNYPSPTFTSFYPFSNEIIAGIYTAGIKGYDYDGNLIYQIPAPDEVSYAVFKDNNYTIAINERLGNGYKEAVIYYAQSGAEKSRLTIDLDNHIEIFPRSGGQYFIFGNDGNNQAHVYLLDAANGGYFEPYTFSSGFSLNDVEQQASDDYLIASQGGIYLYEYAISSLTNRISASNPQHVVTDTLNHQIIFSENNQLLLYNMSNYSSEGYYSHTYPIAAIGVLYNQ